MLKEMFELNPLTAILLSEESFLSSSFLKNYLFLLSLIYELFLSLSYRRYTFFN